MLQRLTALRLPVGALLTKPATPSGLLDAYATALGHAALVPTRGARREDALLGHQRALAGVHLLLVEDNPINQELAVDLLGRAGIVVSVAGNGREALDLLSRERFDAVLMDCQMPVMDGYAATRALRQQPSLQTLPVIAMTANAMVGDRAAVLAAGMNDHIAKPIMVDEMFATLAKWVKPRAPTAGDDASRTDRLELQGVDTLCGIANMGGNGVLYRRMLSLFRQREADFAQRFRAARAAGDIEAAARAVHDLKGTAGTLGMHGIQEAAEALERAFVEGASATDDLVSQVSMRLDRVIEALPEESFASPPRASRVATAMSG